MSNYVFPMPDIGEGIVEAEVVTWHVNAGDTVAEDAPLADVMTDKATVEITSPVAGKVVSLGCSAGEQIVIGAAFVEFALVESDTASIRSAHRPIAAATPSAPESDAASQPAGDSAAIPVSGDQVESNDSDIDNTDPAAGGTKKPVGGYTLNTPVAPDSVASKPAISSVPIKPKIRVVADNGAAAVVLPIKRDATAGQSATGQEHSLPDAQTSVADLAGSESMKTAEPPNPATAAEKALASPAVRRRATALGVAVDEIEGSGEAGRVLHSDLDRWLSRQSPRHDADGSDVHTANARASAVSAHSTEAKDSQVQPSGPVASNVVPITGMRRIIAERMQASKRHIPHFSYVEEIRVEEVEQLRQMMNSQAPDGEAKLSLLHFVLAALVRVLPDYPQCNAHFDEERQQLVQFDHISPGVAVSTSQGLTVPVIHNANTMNIRQMAAEVARLAEGARQQRLSRAELTGGTVTVTSLGPLAGVVTTPVINRPETSIIGPNKMMEKTVLTDGSVRNVRCMNLSSSFDHRVVDGHDAACLIQDVKRLLEYPALLFVPDRSD